MRNKKVDFFGTSCKGHIGAQLYITVFLLVIVFSILSISFDTFKVEALFLDFIVSLLTIFKKKIKNPISMLFYLLINYYIFILPISIFWGAYDFNSLTIVGTLSSRGLDIPHDILFYMLLSIIFKNCFFCTMFLMGDRVEDSQLFLYRFNSSIFIVWVCVLIGLILIGLIVQHAFITIGKYYIMLLILSNIVLFLWKRFNFKLIFGVGILATLTILSGYITRSRGPMVLLFFLFYIVFSNNSLNKANNTISIKSVSFILFGLLVITWISVFRTNNSLTEFFQFNWVGTVGESGIINLIGSHLVGLFERGELPIELCESFFEKILRILPFIDTRPMLADKYVNYFYPQIANAGGGFSYPLVAELYVLGGIIGVVLGAFFLGGGFYFILNRSPRLEYKVIALITGINFFRSEISVTLIYMLSMLMLFYLTIFPGFILPRKH